MRALGAECRGGRRAQDMVSLQAVPVLSWRWEDREIKLTGGSMACAIREAYAATLTVVILVEGQQYDDNE